MHTKVATIQFLMRLPRLLACGDEKSMPTRTKTPPRRTLKPNDVKAVTDNRIDVRHRETALFMRLLWHDEKEVPFRAEHAVCLTHRRAVHRRSLEHHDLKLGILVGKLYRHRNTPAILSAVTDQFLG